MAAANTSLPQWLHFPGFSHNNLETFSLNLYFKPDKAAIAPSRGPLAAMYLRNLMKVYIFIQAVMLSSTLIAGNDEIDFIENRIRQLQDTAKIYYADKGMNMGYQLDEIKSIINKNPIVRYNYKEKRSDTLKLTKNEIKFITQNLDNLTNQTWGENLFLNSIKVPYDSISSYIKKFNRGSWNPKNGFQIWWFSKPIFIRNETYCLYFSVYLCGTLCGHNEWCLYKKNDGVWKKYMILTSGDF